METDDLPQIDPIVDYRAILPIHQKRTIAFINNFLMNSVSFLNDFAESCESRLLQFEYKLQKVEASLLILESQLASIPDTEPVATTATQAEVVKEVVSESIDLPDISNEEEPVVAAATAVKNEAQEGPVASKDSRFSKFFKMVQFGVPPQAVKLKMQAEGVKPDILDNPSAIIPGYELKSDSDDSDNNSSSDSS